MDGDVGPGFDLPPHGEGLFLGLDEHFGHVDLVPAIEVLGLLVVVAAHGLWGDGDGCDYFLLAQLAYDDLFAQALPHRCEGLAVDQLLVAGRGRKDVRLEQYALGKLD